VLKPKNYNIDQSLKNMWQLTAEEMEEREVLFEVER
jgi:hypothetical protein